MFQMGIAGAYAIRMKRKREEERLQAKAEQLSVDYAKIIRTPIKLNPEKFQKLEKQYNESEDKKEKICEKYRHQIALFAYAHIIVGIIFIFASQAVALASLIMGFLMLYSYKSDKDDVDGYMVKKMRRYVLACRVKAAIKDAHFCPKHHHHIEKLRAKCLAEEKHDAIKKAVYVDQAASGSEEEPKAEVHLTKIVNVEKVVVDKE